MFSDRRIGGPLALLLAIAIAALPATVGCGRKEDPKPPPLKNPARTNDLKAQQRGQELILTMGYPTSTEGGLALAGIDRLELTQYTRPAPEFMEREEGDLGDLLDEEGTEGEIGTEEPEAEEPEAEEAPTDEAEGDDTDDDDEADEPEVEEPNPYLKVLIDPDQFRKNSEVAIVLEGDDLETAVVGGEVMITIPLPEITTEPPTAWAFVAQTFTGGLRSRLSNTAAFVPLPPPEMPADFSVTPEPQGIRLTWAPLGECNDLAVPEVADGDEDSFEDDESTDASMVANRSTEVEELDSGDTEDEDLDDPDTDEGNTDESAEIEDGPEGFNIYRRSPSAVQFPEALATVDADRCEYLDRSAAFGTRYIYAITTVTMKRPLVESAAAEAEPMRYIDDFPPTQPRNPVVLAEVGRIRLVWEASTSNDLAGYLIYVTHNEGEVVQLTPEPIRPTEFIHEGTVSGDTYVYTIVAIDTAGNRSEASEEVATRAP